MPDGSTPTLSKSSFLNGCQCPKQLWMKFHNREAFPPVDAQTQAIFDQGHLIGSLAKTLFPGGIEVAEHTISYTESLAATEPALLERRPTGPHPDQLRSPRDRRWRHRQPVLRGDGLRGGCLRREEGPNPGRPSRLLCPRHEGDGGHSGAVADHFGDMTMKLLITDFEL